MIHRVPGHIAPLADELLAPPVELPDCPTVTIVEWRSTPDEEETTSPNDRAIAMLNTACKIVLERFPRFFAEMNISIQKPLHSGVLMSLMPANADGYGSDYRNLNDLEYRFRDRSRSSDGEEIALWGFYHRKTRRLFLRNDLLISKNKVNNDARMIFAHELFHALSDIHGVFEHHCKGRPSCDERLARLFTLKLGMGT